MAKEENKMQRKKISSVKKNISLINIAYKSKNKIKYIAFSEDEQSTT